MDLRLVEYAIVDDDDLDAEARWNGMKVGYANCVRDADQLLIADIKVEDKARRRGIGGELLRKVLREADARGIREIWGSVTADDLANWHGLLDWYGRHGFVAVAPDGQCVRGAVKKIVRRRQD